jgi:hypothetical protein
MKGIYTNTECELGGDEIFDQYQNDVFLLIATETEKKWSNIVRRSWNGLLAEDPSWSKGVLAGQLDEFDRIFKTHFENADAYFMTQAPTWTNIWPLYVDAAIRHARSDAERPESHETHRKVREGAAGKIRFAMKDHGETMCISPPFPLLTKSVVSMMIKSVSEIERALYEVSIVLLSTISNTPTKSNAFDFVGQFFVTHAHTLF